MDSKGSFLHEKHFSKNTGFTRNKLDSGVIRRYISFTPAPDDVLLQCPYEPSHIILQHRLGRHLTRCRKNHQIKLREKGLSLRYVGCPWCEYHMIPELELTSHLDNCSEKNTNPTNSKDISRYAPKLIHHTELDIALSEENWEHDCRGTYDPTTWMKQRGIFRQPVGLTKGEKKRFREQRKALLVQTSESATDNHENKKTDSGTTSVVETRQRKQSFFHENFPLEDDAFCKGGLHLIIPTAPFKMMEPIEDFCRHFAHLKLC